MSDAHRSRLENQAIALAGVAQAARLVDQIARTGSCPVEFVEASVHSLFVFEPRQTEEVFGGIGGIKLGLQNLCMLLASRQEATSAEMVRYVFGLMYLERKFATNSEMMSVVRSRLEHTRFRAEHFSSHVHELCHSVSAIYQDTLSHLSFRIKVAGSQEYLENTQNADRIRTLLLCGIRAAFLWRQLGGRRWRLLLQRRRLLDTAQRLSRELGVV